MSGNKYIEYNHYIKEFLSDGSTCKPLSLVDRHVLSGWKLNTLVGYNAAVRKFLKFWLREQKSPFHLPASAADIYEFCGWAGRTVEGSGPQKIRSKTLSHYLCGLKAWHVFHDSQYPAHTKKKVALMLKASAREDFCLPVKPQKSPVMIQDLLVLADNLTGGSAKDQAIFDLALIAFWGLARLGEVTAGSLVPVTARDVQVLDTNTVITLRAAKTAGPGKLQFLTLNALTNCLCPVAAVQRLLHSCMNANDHLFGYAAGPISHRVPLSKPKVVSRLNGVWHSTGRVHTDAICAAGRWKSACYKLYIRPYTTAAKADSFSLLRALDSACVSSQNSLPSSSSILGSSVSSQNSLPSSSSILGSSVSSQNSLPSSSSILGSSISSQPSSS
ncbi:hypothetical protein PCASD_21737 [Puccinia coronata f. sp. avenae]|uniref:Core-binding (CB) domain-containing protein n=1 Tax=Puccinia coronata f. sp. avenae TaxID=200324 RepID=A0A2N5SCE1_9BASI|nr:hypothetical protein PCASD_21737 [Puccinia coronata f. sp. avenae]